MNPRCRTGSAGARPSSSRTRPACTFGSAARRRVRSSAERPGGGGRRPGTPCRRRRERWPACWCGWRAVPQVPAGPSGRRRTHPSRRLGRRSGRSRGASSAPPRLDPCARGPNRCSSASPRTRSPASTGSPRGTRPAALAAVRRGIRQSIDDLQLLDDRARPAVIDDERQRVFVLRTDVDEVDVQPVDLGDELR